MRDFLINISAGVALSIISWLLFRVLAPFYLAWRYKAPKLEGNWSFFDKEDAQAVGAAVFRQTGEKVAADVTRSTSRNGKPISRTFKYAGRVRDGQLQLSFEEPVSNGFNSGSLVLKVSSDLRALSGYTVYFEHDTGTVVAYPISFRR